MDIFGGAVSAAEPGTVGAEATASMPSRCHNDATGSATQVRLMFSRCSLAENPPSRQGAVVQQPASRVQLQKGTQIKNDLRRRSAKGGVVAAVALAVLALTPGSAFAASGNSVLAHGDGSVGAINASQQGTECHNFGQADQLSVGVDNSQLISGTLYVYTSYNCSTSGGGLVRTYANRQGYTTFDGNFYQNVHSYRYVG